MEQFFDKGTLEIEQIVAGLKQGVAEMRIFPVFCASSLHNIGADLLLNFIVENLPAPTEREGIAATVGGKEAMQKIAESGPASAFVFKTTADPFSGRITYFKVITGTVKNDANLLNVTHSSTERLAHLASPQGKTLQPVPEIHAGDIGAVAKLKDTLTGDTLEEKGAMAVYTPVKLPEPSIAFAIEAKSRNDEDRMGQAVHKILEEMCIRDRALSPRETRFGGMPRRRYGTRQDDSGSFLASHPEKPNSRSAEPAGSPSFAAGQLGSGDRTLCARFKGPHRPSFRASGQRTQESFTGAAQRLRPGNHQLRLAPPHALDR